MVRQTGFACYDPASGPDISLPDHDSLSTMTTSARIGISNISVHQPETRLDNSWYEGALSKKFVKHTGILSRSISFEDEIVMAEKAFQALRKESDCRSEDCAAVVFESPSFVPLPVANRHYGQELARHEQLTLAARRFVDRVGLRPRRVLGGNAFCSGYARAFAMVRDRLISALSLEEHEYVLVINANRISRITDFSCVRSGALFGDFATATLLSRCDSRRYPVKYEVVDAGFSRVEAPLPLFDFEMREQVPTPTSEGGRRVEPSRLVFSLDGMGIADVAPRAMADAAEQILIRNQLQAADIQFIVPHQAGAGIVRLTAMKLETAGFDATVINGLTKDIGNVSSCSVPHALKASWNQLSGNILCPVAAVGAPGKSQVSQGCILLRESWQRSAAA